MRMWKPPDCGNFLLGGPPNCFSLWELLYQCRVGEKLQPVTSELVFLFPLSHCRAFAARQSHVVSTCIVSRLHSCKHTVHAAGLCQVSVQLLRTIPIPWFHLTVTWWLKPWTETHKSCLQRCKQLQLLRNLITNWGHNHTNCGRNKYNSLQLISGDKCVGVKWNH